MAIAPALRSPDALNLSEAQIGGAGSSYLFGAIVGALVFGRLTDMLGRKKLFLITLSLYLTATAASALSWNFASFAVLRALTGAGIGGEYSAVNSAIDELCRRACVVAPTSRSTARTGSAPRSAPR